MSIDNEKALEVLREFLNLPHNPEAVFDKFKKLDGAYYCPENRLLNNGFLYIPPTRPNTVLLVAHVDVFSNENQEVILVEDDTTIRNLDDLLGADDRAGCAIIWLLKELGHGILLVDGEEIGLKGAKRVMSQFDNSAKRDILFGYQFIVEFDRQGYKQYKCYGLGSDEFRAYVEKMTGFSEPDRFGHTDINELAVNFCGVNLSCGWHEAHIRYERLVKSEWLETVHTAYNWLKQDDLPKFYRPMGV